MFPGVSQRIVEKIHKIWKNPQKIDIFHFFATWSSQEVKNQVSEFLLDVGRVGCQFRLKSRENVIFGIFRSKKSFLAILAPWSSISRFRDSELPEVKKQFSQFLLDIGRVTHQNSSNGEKSDFWHF